MALSSPPDEKSRIGQPAGRSVARIGSACRIGLSVFQLSAGDTLLAGAPLVRRIGQSRSFVRHRHGYRCCKRCTIATQQ
ncbi:hypothetical protein KIN20_008191 [Parelaphostrongylus tenuis]|uniref:Uncharacterized protein n=1 Tax=Parelaphostrongylus tenuis TaxID=148309 RepID=A0AAD5QHB1_PARTN|nr:hypothetical protein KIN20_008191 [Parelaphostrongylus tenuis]